MEKFKYCLKFKFRFQNTQKFIRACSVPPFKIWSSQSCNLPRTDSPSVWYFNMFFGKAIIKNQFGQKVPIMQEPPRQARNNQVRCLSLLFAVLSKVQAACLVGSSPSAARHQREPHISSIISRCGTAWSIGTRVHAMSSMISLFGGRASETH